MQEEIHKISNAVNYQGVETNDKIRVSAIKIAEEAINTYRGELLKRAFNISLACAELANELEKDNDG
jgi:hypothetical protein